MLSSWPSLIITYMNAPTDYWCARPGFDKNVTPDPTELEWGVEVRATKNSNLP